MSCYIMSCPLTKPQQPVTWISVANAAVLSISQLYFETQNIASTFTTRSVFHVAVAVDSTLMCLSTGATIPPWGSSWCCGCLLQRSLKMSLLALLLLVMTTMTMTDDDGVNDDGHDDGDSDDDGDGCLWCMTDDAGHAHGDAWLVLTLRRCCSWRWRC